MKRVLLASVGLVALAALAGSATAADLPPRFDPVPRAPFMGPAYNWTGFYVGVSGGGGFGNSDWRTVTTTTGDIDLGGWLVGGTLGYNWQSGAFVFGLEGDISASGIDGATTLTCPLTCTTSNTWLATVRGRVGYAFDRFLPFVTGGLAIGDIRADIGNVNVASDTNVGWTVGGGLEFAIMGNWTAKAEYLYVDLGDFNCGIACGLSTTDLVSFRTHIVRGGINYRF